MPKGNCAAYLPPFVFEHQQLRLQEKNGILEPENGFATGSSFFLICRVFVTAFKIVSFSFKDFHFYCESLVFCFFTFVSVSKKVIFDLKLL